MPRLIYHSAESYDGVVSPFDTAVRETADANGVRIVCPYLAPKYLQRVLEHADEWRLVTDVQECLSVLGGQSRDEMRRFLEANREQVHDFPGVHAKVVVSDTSAVVGSANLTETGMTGRTEMAVEFRETEKLRELNEWFGRLWSESAPVDSEELDQFLDSASTSSSARSRPTMVWSSDAPRVNAALADETDELASETTDLDGALVERVRMGPSCEWVDSYFDLMADLISATGLPEDDPRLVTGIGQDDRITISLNTRMALGAFFHEKPLIGLVIGDDYAGLETLIEASELHFNFTPQSGEKESETPHWMEFETDPRELLTASLRRNWIQTSLREVERSAGSPHQDTHDPLVYRAAMDEQYRRRVLKTAFPNEG
jgi:hypothetical protein